MLKLIRKLFYPDVFRMEIKVKGESQTTVFISTNNPWRGSRFEEMVELEAKTEFYKRCPEAVNDDLSKRDIHITFQANYRYSKLNDTIEIDKKREVFAYARKC